MGSQAPRLKSGCLTERIWAEPSTVGEAKEMLSWNQNKKVGFLLGVLFLAGWGSINDLQLKNYTRIPKKDQHVVGLQVEAEWFTSGPLELWMILSAIVKPLRTFVGLAYDSHGLICDMKCDMMTIPR